MVHVMHRAINLHIVHCFNCCASCLTLVIFYKHEGNYKYTQYYILVYQTGFGYLAIYYHCRGYTILCSTSSYTGYGCSILAFANTRRSDSCPHMLLDKTVNIYYHFVQNEVIPYSSIVKSFIFWGVTFSWFTNKTW
jgi:hypothetical protein